MKPIEYLNQRQVAKKLGVARDTIARWRDQGKMPEPDGIVGFNGALWLEKTIDKWRGVG